MKGSGAGLKSQSFREGQSVVLKCPLSAPFLPTLAAAVLNGSIWEQGAPEPHELPQLTIYLPTQASAEPLKLAFLELSPNGATFLPRICVLGDADPPGLFAAYGARMASTPAALRLLEAALAVPPAFEELERQVRLTALVLNAAQSLRGGLSPDERFFLNITPAGGFGIAAQIAALIAEAHAEGADLSRIAKLDGRASGGGQLSLKLLHAVLTGWQAQKTKAGKLDREERRNRLMAIEAEFIRNSDAPVIVAGSSGSVAATLSLMEAALARPKSAVVLYGLDDHANDGWAAAGGSPEHWQHGLHGLLARLKIDPADIRALPPAGRPPHPNPLPKGRGSAGAPLREDREYARTLPGVRDRTAASSYPSLGKSGAASSPSPLGERTAASSPSPLGEKAAASSSPPLGKSGAASSPSPLGERAGVRGDSGALARRAKFLSEALRPAQAMAPWASFIQTLKEEASSPAPGLSLIEAETIQDEAAAIALILRHSLETPGQTAALVTPSDSLLARVRHALAQWGAASPADTGMDRLALCALLCSAGGKPQDLVELLRQASGEASHHTGRIAEIMDLGVLRQMWRPSSLAGMPAALSRAGHAAASGEARHPAMKRISAAEWDRARAFAKQLIEALSPLTSSGGKRLALTEWIAAHQTALSNLERLGVSGLGSGGRENSALKRLGDAATRALTLSLQEYADFFAQIVPAASKRPLRSPHPRLFLWKPMDARLMSAGVVVLGGLNEGCWPQAAAPDPWLSRGDRAFVGLPPTERRIGRSAHDFTALAASAPSVFLTRSKEANGSLARPSRWVSRIKALAAGAGQANSLKPAQPWLDWIAAHYAPGTPVPVLPPQPRPPLAARPRRLSVTAIETWLANPYAIYARHILRLDPLRGLHETSDARDRGILYHAALHQFFQAFPREPPKNAASELVRKLDEAAEDLGFNLENAPFWRPRFARFAAWFADTGPGRRAGVQSLKSEVGGKLWVAGPGGPFEITSRADRIDVLEGGSLRIYDFKTSTNAAKLSAARGAPQLALEGLLAKEGAFAGIAAGSSAELFYIVATGGEPPGEIVEPRMPAGDAIRAAHAGTLRQIERFDDETVAYTYEARAIYRDKAESDPYAHLARVREWSAGVEEVAGDD